MEYIVKELRSNGIHINEEVFKTQMKKMIEENGEAYEEILTVYLQRRRI